MTKLFSPAAPSYLYKYYNLKIFSLSVILMVCLSANSQIYSVNVIQLAYTPLENSEALIHEAWNDPEFSVPIGFSFPFFNDVIDTLFSQDFFAGGYLSTSLNYSSTGILNFFSTDLIDRGFVLDSTISPITYKTDGSIGKRVFTLEYKNAGFFAGELNDGVYTDYINIQIRLKEETGVIEVHIGPYSVQNPSLNFEGFPGPTIGLIEDFNFEDGSVTGETIIIAGDPSNPEIITNFSPAYLEWPIPENTVYIFTRETTNTSTPLVEDNLQFYLPNPSPTWVFLKPGYYGTVVSSVSIINSIGKIVTTTDETNIINLTDLESGIYFLSFQTKKGPVIQKISKTN